MRHYWVASVAGLLVLVGIGRPPSAGSQAAPRVPPGSAAPAYEQPRSFRVVQPVQMYFLPFGKGNPGESDEMSFFTPWAYYTHLGTDYGLMGPGQQGVVWKPGQVTVDLAAGEWAGMWHSLAGVVRKKDQSLDFLKCYPPWVRNEYQPRCVGIALRVGGQGTLKVEVGAPDGRILWARSLQLPPGSPPRDVVLECSPEKLRETKQLNWVAEPGSRLQIDSLGLLLDYPEIPFAKRVFLISYAKLARCYVPGDGLVKDRAHFPAGLFDTVPGSGLFCLASCAAWRMGIVDRHFAERTLRQVHQTVESLPRPLGLLPHFVTRDHGRFRVHPGSEYSTVDTSLYYHSMLLAAQMLGDDQILADLGQEVRAIQFPQLTDPEGYVLRGLQDDGRTRLDSSWRDWGGETAMVLLLERMAEGKTASVKMSRSGRVYAGVGFIGEIQSLFYPQFSQDRTDGVTGINWLQTRRQLLREQMDYFPRTRPDSAAARMGLFGLSAGEGLHGAGYVANGTDMPNVELIHPHYILMSGLAGLHPADNYRLLQSMETQGLLPPWGMVENVKADLSEYLPMLGSLNASFECLGAYHLWARATGEWDQVYEAAGRCPPLKDAVEVFYPPNVPGGK